jgi:hypothetical protein
MASETERRGSCLCGAVRIAIKTTSNSVSACHCSMCRKWGGGPLLAIECGRDVQFDGTDSISVFGSSDWPSGAFVASVAAICSTVSRERGTTWFLLVWSMTENNGFLINRFLSMRSRRSTRSRTKRRT